MKIINSSRNASLVNLLTNGLCKQSQRWYLVGKEGIVANGHAFLITLLHFKTMVAMATKIEAKAWFFFLWWHFSKFQNSLRLGLVNFECMQRTYTIWTCFYQRKTVLLWKQNWWKNVFQFQLLLTVSKIVWWNVVYNSYLTWQLMSHNMLLNLVQPQVSSAVLFSMISSTWHLHW